MPKTCGNTGLPPAWQLKPEASSTSIRHQEKQAARQEGARTLEQAHEAAAWALDDDTSSTCQLPVNDGPGLNRVPDTQLSMLTTAEQHEYHH